MNKADNQDLNRLLHTLGSLMNAGVNVINSLQIVLKQTKNRRLNQVLNGLIADINNGAAFHISAGKFPNVFSAPVLAKIKTAEAMGTLDAAFLELAEAGVTADPNGPEDDDQITSANIVKLVDQIILEAIRNRASDIHLEWVQGNLRARLRIDGTLREAATSIPKMNQKMVIERIKIMGGLNLKETRLPQDGRIQLNVEGKEIDLRVTVSPYVFGESAVIRILNRATVTLKLDRVCESPETLGKLRSWIKRPNGLIIATGPTCSGKTTLLYAMIQELNTPDVKIVTVEDPVEYIIDGVNQQQINQNIGLTFARSLRSQLRQDPDIMVVGEIRDLETAQVMIQAVITGHLVLTTLHTHDAPEAIRRLIDIGIEPFLVNSALTGVVAQRLVRAICKHCKEEYTPESWVMDILGANRPTKFLRGKGCAQCGHSGYRGRIAVHELMELDDSMRKLINSDPGLDELRRHAIASGLVTLRADGLAKVSQGLTTVEEVLQVCQP